MKKAASAKVVDAIKRYEIIHPFMRSPGELYTLPAGSQLELTDAEAAAIPKWALKLLAESVSDGERTPKAASEG